MKFEGLTFGVPREIMHDEHRVAATPETVKKMKDQGANVLVEAGAGEGSYFHDDEYREAGAVIEPDVRRLYERSDVVLKVKEPQYNMSLNIHEIDMMRQNAALVSFLHPASPSNHDMVRKLASRGITSFTLDSIPRISRAQHMDALTSMSTIAGYKGVLLAAERLPKFIPMVATASGVIQPSKALVIGVGVVGLQAVATAKRLGAVVSAADIRAEACEQAKSLGAAVVPLDIPQELATGPGGYAKKLPDEWVLKERDMLAQAVASSDIVILSALIPGKLAPVLLTETMVSSMRPGSVIVDISIDQGGNCALTVPGEMAEVKGVGIIGYKNIPGAVPVSATGLFSRNILHFIEHIVDNGAVRTDTQDEIIASCLLTIDGAIVHTGAREALNLS